MKSVLFSILICTSLNSSALEKFTVKFCQQDIADSCEPLTYESEKSTGDGLNIETHCVTYREVSGCFNSEKNMPQWLKDLIQWSRQTGPLSKDIYNNNGDSNYYTGSPTDSSGCLYNSQGDCISGNPYYNGNSNYQTSPTNCYHYGEADMCYSGGNTSQGPSGNVISGFFNWVGNIIGSILGGSSSGNNNGGGYYNSQGDYVGGGSSGGYYNGSTSGGSGYYNNQGDYVGGGSSYGGGNYNGGSSGSSNNDIGGPN